MTFSRRSFLKGTLATSAVAVSSRGCGNDVEPAPIIDVEVVDDPSSFRNGQIAVPVPKYPELVPVGGAVMLRIKPLPARERAFVVPERGVLLIHRGTPEDPPEFVATRADCPHQGCPLGYSAKSGQIECPCHSSRFRAVADANDPALCIGLVTHPPAQGNLTVYGIRRAGEFVYVDLRTDLSCGVRSDFPPVVAGIVEVPIDAYPSLGTVGGKLIGKPAGQRDKLIVARTAEDQVVCLSVVCTHKGCDVGLDLENTRMHCPCHGSEFSYDGAVLRDPGTPIEPLKKYEASFDGSVVRITIDPE